MEENTIIKKDFNLPDNSNDLSRADGKIHKLKDKFKTLIQKGNINDDNHETLFEDIIKILDFVGDLSLPAFGIKEELEELYFKQFSHAPALAKELWLKHYERIHHPYNLLKNRCFRLIEELDEEYFRGYNKKQTNWKA